MKFQIILLVGLLILLSGCSYRVAFDSNPQGAAVICGSEVMGYTPINLYYDSSVKKKPYINASACYAKWPSGAQKSYSERVPVYSGFDVGTLITAQRPDTPGYDYDVEVGKQRMLARGLQWQQPNSYSYSSSNSNYSSSNSNYSSSNSNSFKAPPIYNANECIGSVVNGKCTGTINPSPSTVLRKKCYGAMVNGECNGAIGY